jgi:hypothetical protein
MNFPGRRLVRASYHRSSHRTLLQKVALANRNRKPVDAVIVPTARPATSLKSAIEVARDLSCRLVVLCSKKADVAEVARFCSSEHVGAWVIATGSVKVNFFADFATSLFLSRTGYEIGSDLNEKRNIALLLCRSAGWRRVLFLDDDIAAVERAHVEVAAGLVASQGFDAVGLKNEGYPDNSVVCHVNRKAGRYQAEFIGAGCAVVPTDEIRSFFPKIYNEDWFYFLGNRMPPKLTVVGRMEQRPYDPFESPLRAQKEEFGDCLAEGLFSMLDRGQSIEEATVDYWAQFLSDRLELIKSLQTWADGNAGDNVVVALKQARSMCDEITPTHCVGFLDAWRQDLSAWRSYVDRWPKGEGIMPGLRALGLSGVESLSVVGAH